MVESLTRAQSRRQEREYRYQEAAKQNPFAHDFSNDRAEKLTEQRERTKDAIKHDKEA